MADVVRRGNLALDALVTSPGYMYDGHQIGYLDVSATYDNENRRIFVNVLNRSADSDIPARIETVEGPLSPDASIWEMNNADLKAVNSFGDERVRPATRAQRINPANNGFTYTFPKHSLTILTLKLS